MTLTRFIIYFLLTYGIIDRTDVKLITKRIAIGEYTLLSLKQIRNTRKRNPGGRRLHQMYPPEMKLNST